MCVFFNRPIFIFHVILYPKNVFVLFVCSRVMFFIVCKCLDKFIASVLFADVFFLFLYYALLLLLLFSFLFVLVYTECNRTYYGNLGITYNMELHRPKEDRIPYICDLTFTAAGGLHGDIIQVSGDSNVFDYICTLVQQEDEGASLVLRSIFNSNLFANIQLFPFPILDCCARELMPNAP